MKTRRLLLFVFVFSLPVLLLLTGCSRKDSGHKADNIRPSVKVSGGPPQGGTSTYSVPIYWFAWDDDGVVDHFLYAIDDTTVWTETTYFQGSFLFSADSVRSGDEFGQWHTFWIKAVDNEGAESYPDYLAFDARTIAPKTTIISPTCNQADGTLFCWGARPVGLSVKVVWEGEDLDSRDPKQLPVAYKWRLFNLTKAGLPNGCPDEATCASILDSTPYTPDSTSFWSAPTTETEIRFTNLQAGSFWLFGVRAIDEAGAIEPNLVLWRNVTYFRTMTGYGFPTLTICEGASCHEYPSDGPVWEREAPVGKQLVFTWSGDASAYGGTITGYTYGVDIEDLNDPSQWEGWSSEVRSAKIVFNSPGVHYFYVKVRDYADAETIGIVQLNIIEFLFDRDLLFIDDYFDLGTGDLPHDTFVNTSFGRYHAYTDTMYTFNFLSSGPTGDPREIGGTGTAPSLTELSRYKILIWDCYAPLAAYDCGLRRVVQGGILDVYLKGGGRLCLYGTEVVKGTDTDFTQYPIDLSRGDYQDKFACKYLKISGLVNRSFSGSKGDGFKGAFPNRASSDALPILDVNLSLPNTTVYGLYQIEAVMSAMQEPDLTQRPDTMYLYRSNYITSSYYKKACGLRFFDAYGNSKVVWMGFPIQWFYAQQAESLGTFVMDWMFEDLSP